MLRIGLTGGIGSGKSAVAGMLHDFGATILDADKLGHEVYLPGTEGWQAVVDAFGKDILQSTQEIDRKKLGGIVFSNPAQLARLNSIMHPRIAAKVEERFRQLAAQGVKVAVLEAAVLIEAKWSYLVDELWVTLVDEAVAVRRVMARNGLPEDAVRSRIRAQISNADRARQAAVVIDNNGDVDQLRRRVQELWHKRIQPRIGEHVHS